MLNIEKINPKSKLELQTLCYLIIDFYKEIYSDILKNETINYILSFVNLESIKNKIIEDNQENFLIKENKDIIGFYELNNSNEQLKITKFYILKQKRNKNKGKFVLKEIIKNNNEKNVTIQINEKSEQTQNFFISQGFKFYKKIARYIGDEHFLYDNLYLYIN